MTYDDTEMNCTNSLRTRTRCDTHPDPYTPWVPQDIIAEFDPRDPYWSSAASVDDEEEEEELGSVTAYDSQAPPSEAAATALEGAGDSADLLPDMYDILTQLRNKR